MSTNAATTLRCGGQMDEVQPGLHQHLLQRSPNKSFIWTLRLALWRMKPDQRALPWPEALQAAGLQVIVAAASRIPHSVTAGAKCDRLDCIKLADYTAKGMLKPIAIPTSDEEAHRTFLRRRHTLVDSVRRSKQRIKSMLLFLGVQEPIEVTNWSKRAPLRYCGYLWSRLQS